MASWRDGVARWQQHRHRQTHHQYAMTHGAALVSFHFCYRFRRFRFSRLAHRRETMICHGRNGGRRVALRLASAGGPCGARTRTRRGIMPHRAATEQMPAPPVAAAMHAGLSIRVRTHMTDLDGAGEYADRETGHKAAWASRNFRQRGFTVGIGGPVGSGKTALTLKLAETLRDRMPLGVVTNDIFTQEDAEFLVRQRALPKDRIMAVETGGCPHAAIREDVTANLAALERLTRSITAAAEQETSARPRPPLLICESGGDNLAANFSNELADFTLYVIDVAGGDKVPRKGGPGITQSDVLVINKTDLAEAVGASLDVMDRDAKLMRGDGPTVFASVKNFVGVPDIIDHILRSFHLATGGGDDGHHHEHDHRG